MPLSNCEVKLNLTWSKDCVIIDTATQVLQSDNLEISAPQMQLLLLKKQNFMC